MVRPQQASGASDAGGADTSEPPPGPAPLNGECRLHGPAEGGGPAVPPPLPLAMPPPPVDGTRYTPSPHSQDSASPPQAASPHVVLLHIVDGESIQLQRGDNVEFIRGPATVQMVSTNSSPPMAYPVQVPPGHMMQQVVDGMGTLRHVILSPEPRGITALPPYSTSQPPPPFYPAPPQGFAPPPQPPPFPAHAMYGAAGQPAPTGLMATSAPTMQQGPSPPPQPPPSQTQQPPPALRDQRSQRRLQRMRRKLNERQRPPTGSRTSPSPSPSPGDHKNGRRAGSEPEENGEPSGDSTSSVCSQQDDEDRAVCEFLSKLRPPQVSEISSSSALVSWGHPDVTVDQLSIAPDQLSYELSMAESRPGSGSSGAAPPPPAAAFRRVCSDRAVSTELSQLRPATTYYLTLQCSLAALQGTVTAPVSFTTLSAPPDQPRPPTLQNKTKTSLHVRWTAPADHGSRITQYVLECDAGQGFSEVQRTRSKHHTVSHLQPSSGYRLRVAACNELGQGVFSEPVSLQTSGLAPPQPEPPRLDQATATELALSWSRRDSDDSYSVHMEGERSKYGFLPVYSGTETQHRVQELTRNTSYKFKLRAINEEGASRWSEPVSYRTRCLPPAAPARPSVRGRLHAHQARLRWEPPADTGGAAVSEFQLQILREPDHWETVYSGPGQEHTVDGLQPGTAYQLRVRCVGEGGLSEPSDATTVTTEPVCPGRCQPPRLHGKPRATACSVKWAAPEFCGGAPGSLTTEYELDLSPGETGQGDGGASRVYSGPDTECTVSTLLPGRPYQIQVRAVNRVGAGPWSEPLRLVSGAGPPSAPAPPCVSARSPHALLARWSEPASNGAPVSEYRLEVATGSGAFQPVYSGPASQHEPRGLLPATAYRLRVAATNSAGAGPVSEPALVVTPAASPAAVTAVEAEPAATSLTVSWQPPPDHGAEVLHYTVEVSERLSSTSGPQTQLTVGQLAPDTVYRIRVQAVNSVGPGPFSAVYRWSTLSLPPSPPPLEVTHTAHNFVRLRWGDAKQQTERIVFSLECEAKNGEFYVVYEGSGTQFKMSRLAEDTEYRLRICAANEAGDGPYSNVVSTRTTRQPLPTVRGLRVSDKTERGCSLEWLPVKSGWPADQRPSYQLQLMTPSRQHEFHTIYSGSDLQFRLSGLEPQTDYQARVCCLPPGAGEPGPYSGALRFSTPAAPPPPPVSRAAATHQASKSAERKPWTEQQWAVAILGAFGVVALLLAVLVSAVIG